MTKEEKEKLMENDVENLIRWRIWKERTFGLLVVGGCCFVSGIVAIIVAPAIVSGTGLGGIAGLLGEAGIVLIILGVLILSPGVIIKIIAEPRYNAYKQIVFGSKERKEAATESLINYVQNDKKGEAAIDILGEIGNRRAVDPLIQALKDENGYKNDYVRWKVRKSAAEALGKIGDARAVEPLIQALKDKDVVVRRNAAEALGEIGDAKTVEPLIQALKDEDEGVRTAAKQALEKIKAKKS